MSLAFIIIISFWISFIWLYYFRMMDIFENEKPLFIILTFIIGTVFPFIIYPIHTYIYQPIGIANSSDSTLNFLFYTLAVGLLEECVKALPVLIIYKVFKNAINEPLDFIVYACVSALGFAFGENIEYAQSYGEYILLSRAVLSVPAHMFFSSIFIYGFLLYKYHKADTRFIYYYLFFGILAHGIYDYLLDSFGLLGLIMTLVFFLLIVSVFVNIINNGLNNSAFYSPKKSVNQDKVMGRLSSFYLIAVFGIFISVLINGEEDAARSSFVAFVVRDVPILWILIVRLSRVSIIPEFWREIKLEFPFQRQKHNYKDSFGIFGLNIKGESYNDFHISLLYEEEINVVPISSRKSYLKKPHRGIIEKKLYLNDESVFLVKVFLDTNNIKFKHFFLITKKNGITHNEDNHPIVSINSIKDHEKREMMFHEWVILKKVK